MGDPLNGAGQAVCGTPFGSLRTGALRVNGHRSVPCDWCEPLCPFIRFPSARTDGLPARSSSLWGFEVLRLPGFARARVHRVG